MVGAVHHHTKAIDLANKAMELYQIVVVKGDVAQGFALVDNLRAVGGNVVDIVGNRAPKVVQGIGPTSRAHAKMNANLGERWHQLEGLGWDLRTLVEYCAVHIARE